MTDQAFEELWAPYRQELQRDYVGLWELVGRVRRVHPEWDDDTVRDAVLGMVERALTRGEAEIGNQPRGVDGRGHVWHDAVDGIITRVRQELVDLGRDPIPGEIAWLQAAQPR